MGLIHAFVNWGIRLLDNTEKDVRRIGQRLGHMPLSWRQTAMMYPAKDGILWRVPDPEVPMASSFFKVQALLVTENEQVMLLRNGVLQQDMERGVLLRPGLYDISRMQMRDQIEVVWTTTRELRLRWGVADVLTQDRISIGASGYYSLVIHDPEAFWFNLVGNAQVYKEDQLLNFVKPEVNAVLRDLIARTSVMEFQLAYREFMEASREKLQPIFDRWGLEFRGLTIENQQIPEQFRQAAAGKTIITMEKEAQLEGARVDLSLAQLEAQKAFFLAQIDASKRLAMGRAEIELMQQQQAIGLDPLDVRRIEAAEIAAANPSQGSVYDSRAQIINQLVGQPAIQPINPIITGSLIPNASMLPPANTHNSGPLSAASVQQTGGAGTSREKIQEMLDKLDERLINGEITEEKHSELYQRLQKRLNDLP